MMIDLRDVLRGAREFHFLMDRDWWRKNDLEDTVIGLASPLEVSVVASSAGNKYLLDGHISGQVTVQCDRCLEPYGYEIHTGYHVVLAAQQSADGGVEVELLQEDLEVQPFDGFVIELNEIAREQVYLALPMKNLCRDDCGGLCPVCGNNLNRGTCRCTLKT